MKGNYDGAKRKLAELKEMVSSENNPQKYDGYHNLMGMTNLMSGNAEKGVEYFEKVVNQSNTYFQYHKGLAYKEFGNFDKAKELSGGFLEKIKAKNLDVIPSPKELDDIWFYMNTRINFSKLLRENRPVKIKQQCNFLSYVCNKTAPDNAMIIYFFGLMQKKHLVTAF